MGNYKKHRLPGLNQDIVIPGDWEIIEDDYITTIFDPQLGFGALQLSIYLVEAPTQIDLKEELLRLAPIPNNIKINIINNQLFSYAEFENDEDTFWRYWLFRKNKHIIFASYNCSKTDRRKEDVIVDAILNSVM